MRLIRYKGLIYNEAIQNNKNIEHKVHLQVVCNNTTKEFMCLIFPEDI